MRTVHSKQILDNSPRKQLEMLSHMTKKNIDDIDGIMPFSLYILYETMGEFLINYLLDPPI